MDLNLGLFTLRNELYEVAEANTMLTNQEKNNNGLFSYITITETLIPKYLKNTNILIDYHATLYLHKIHISSSGRYLPIVPPFWYPFFSK